MAVIGCVPVAGLAAQSAPIADREWKAWTQGCETLGGPAFHRMLDAVARSYLVER